MPFVWVRMKNQLEIFHQAKKLVKKLPCIVAEALSVPGTEGELSADEIEVKVELFSSIREVKNTAGFTCLDTSKDVMKDISTKDIEIIILANYYPERNKNLDERQKIILNRVKEFISPEFSGFVWVLLTPSSFGEF